MAPKTWRDQPKHLSRECWSKENRTRSRVWEKKIATPITSQMGGLGKVVNIQATIIDTWGKKWVFNFILSLWWWFNHSEKHTIGIPSEFRMKMENQAKLLNINAKGIVNTIKMEEFSSYARRL